jgi:hypothetical protein
VLIHPAWFRVSHSSNAGYASRELNELDLNGDVSAIGDTFVVTRLVDSCEPKVNGEPAELSLAQWPRTMVMEGLQTLSIAIDG